MTFGRLSALAELNTALIGGILRALQIKPRRCPDQFDRGDHLLGADEIVDFLALLLRQLLERARSLHAGGRQSVRAFSRRFAAMASAEPIKDNGDNRSDDPKFA